MMSQREGGGKEEAFFFNAWRRKIKEHLERWSSEGEEMWGRGGATQGLEKTTMIWTELNTSFIPKSKPFFHSTFISFIEINTVLQENKIKQIWVIRMVSLRGI